MRENMGVPFAARRGLQLASVLTLSIASILPAHAALSDTLHPFGGIIYSYDDNLLRLRDDGSQDTGERSDKYVTKYAGLRLDRPVGLQRFVVTAQASKVDFDRLEVLNYTGKQVNGDWLWALGTHLSGTLGAYYTESLPAFTDYHSTDRNLRTNRGQNFELRYRFHPSWQVRGGVSRNDSRNDLPSQAYLDRDGKSSTVGFDYLAASGSSVGLQFGRIDTDYLQPRRVNGVVSTQSFRQDEAKLKISWKYSPVTQVEFLGGWARRRNEVFTSNDSSGLDGRLVVDWSPAATVKLTGNLWREYTPFDGISTVAYSQDKGASVSGVWSVQARVRLNADARYVKRDLFQAAGAAPALRPEDSFRRVSAGASYVFHESLSLNLNAFRESRSSNSTFTNRYRANGASLTASVQF
ncbi:XrtB/PEP-CTERM-associated polysaccharide biosynthesis outer membrane protein EpsL [Duganella sp. PWIR1]